MRCRPRDPILQRTIYSAKGSSGAFMALIEHTHEGLYFFTLAFVVTQPVSPPAMARTSSRLTGCDLSSFGPSKTENVSPTSNFRLTPLDEANWSCNSISCVALYDLLALPWETANTEPLLPLVVIQPFLSSFLATPSTLKTPFSLSSTSFPQVVNFSPSSNFRTTLADLMSWPSVMPTPALIIRVSDSVANIWPDWFFSVTQPMALSLVALTLVREMGSAVSCLGTPTCSRISFSFRVRMAALSNLDSFCKGVSLTASKNGFGTLRKNTVPWLPLIVIQPSVPSTTDLHFTLSTLSFSSWIGPSTTTTSSPFSAFRRALLLPASHSVVKAITLL